MSRAHVLLLALLAAPVAAAGPEPTPPLARVGPDPVTVDELRAEFVRRHGGHTVFLGGETEVRSFLKIVIERRLLLQEAYRLGLDELPAVRDTVARIAEKKALVALIEEEIDARAKPTEEEIRSAWEARTSELYQTQQIVVATRAEAEEIRRQLDAGADIGELARQRSIARSAARGGGLGTLGWGVMGPEWEAVVFALAPGATSAPFEGEEGWEIVRMIARTPAERPDFEAARSRIQGILSRRKLEARRAEFSAELWRRHGARLSGVLDPTPAALAALQEQAPGTVLATWEGGSLDLATFARGLDLAALAALPESAGRRQLDDLLRRTVNDALARREVARRRLAERPDLAAEVRTEQENLMERVLLADHVLKGVAVEEAEVRAWYDAHPEEFVTPERRRVAHLVTATEPEAATLAERIRRGESFEELVRQHSLDTTTASVGGDLGWITAAQVPPDFAPVLALGEGELSAPLRSEHGWHLMRVRAIEPPRQLGYEEAHDALRTRLFERAKATARAKWVEVLRAATPVTVDEAAVARFVAESGREQPVAPPGHG
jgi:peptidyl-prolyl cis-trans isomerase C